MFKERAVGLGVVGAGILGYENSEVFRDIVDISSSYVFDLLESSELIQRISQLDESYSTPTLIAGAVTALLVGKVIQMGNNYAQEKRFNRMDYSDMINISYTFFPGNGTIKIKNEGEGHLPTIFTGEPVALKAIYKAAKNTSGSNIVLNFQNNRQQGWQIYDRIRDHFELLADKINVSEEHAKDYAGKSLTEIEYIGILTKGPQYTVDEEQTLREVEGHDTPHTKTEIRFLPFPLPEIESAIAWFQNEAETDLKSEMQNDTNKTPQEPIEQRINRVINKVCFDKDSCCGFTDRFIIFMLDKEEGDEEDLNFKYPTYRKRIVALAQAAREYYNGNPHLRYTVSI